MKNLILSHKQPNKGSKIIPIFFYTILCYIQVIKYDFRVFVKKPCLLAILFLSLAMNGHLLTFLLVFLVFFFPCSWEAILPHWILHILSVTIFQNSKLFYL